MKIFLSGSMSTEKEKKELMDIAQKLKDKTNIQIICPAEKNIEKIEKLQWVLDNITSSDILIALQKKISFGTAVEIGYALRLNKRIIILAGKSNHDYIRNHVISQHENINVVLVKKDTDYILEILKSLK